MRDNASRVNEKERWRDDLPQNTKKHLTEKNNKRKTDEHEKYDNNESLW